MLGLSGYYVVRRSIIMIQIDNLQLILEQETIKEIKELAVMFGISGYSKMRKQEMIEYIIEKLTDVDRCRQLLLLATDKELTLLDKIIKKEVEFHQDFEVEDVLYFLVQGFAFLSKKGKLQISEEMAAIFSQIRDEEFVKEQQRIHTIHQYTGGLVKLYGIVTVDKVVEIYNLYQEEAVTKDEVKEIFKRFTERVSTYSLKGKYFIHQTVLMEEQGKENLLKEQEGKPVFVPSKEEIAKCYDDFSFLSKNEYVALSRQVQTFLTQDPLKVRAVCEEIYQNCILGCKLEELIQLFEDYDCGIQNVKQAEHVVPYVINLYNNTRMWKHNGYTPVELEQVTNRVDYVLKTGMATPPATARMVNKVGRNEPCPCGSKKKYKHCCGR